MCLDWNQGENGSKEHQRKTFENVQKKQSLMISFWFTFLIGSFFQRMQKIPIMIFYPFNIYIEIYYDIFIFEPYKECSRFDLLKLVILSTWISSVGAAAFSIESTQCPDSRTIGCIPGMFAIRWSKNIPRMIFNNKYLFQPIWRKALEYLVLEIL